MPIRVVCPSCGRVGRAPERAIGVTVQCPGCGHRHRLSADMVVPEDPAAPPAPAPAPAPSTRPSERPRVPPPVVSSSETRREPPKSRDDLYDLGEAPPLPNVMPMRAPIGPPPSISKDRDEGFSLPTPVIIGGVAGVAVLSIVVTFVAIRVFGGRGAETPPVAAAPAAPAAQPAAPAPAAAPIVVPAVNSAPNPAAAQAAAAKPPAAPVAAVNPPAAPSVAGATAPAPAPAPAPADEGGAVSVLDAMQTTDEVAPEPSTDSPLIARARAGAAALATADDGAGKTLSTADIVAESEASVALVKGKSSSGTGFLVGPGLLATNAHVIDDEFISDLEIRFVSADDKHKAPLRPQLLYEDAERDLAFLAIDTDLKPLRVAKAYTFRKGEDITVIGNPGMGDGQVLENAVSHGVMSTKTQVENKPFYQINIAINPGNSGGPVFDSSGRVIGVATLKSAKQEAMGFSIPIEDFHAALAKLVKEKTADGEMYRSRHRERVAVKGLGNAGALMCYVIDLRRIYGVTKADFIKDMLDRLEPIVAEMDKEMSPSFEKNAPRVGKDPLIAPSVREKITNLNKNYEQIRDYYAKRKPIQDGPLRLLKQTHKKLFTELASSLKVDYPQQMLIAFEDRSIQQPTVVMGGQNLGSYGSRLQKRSLSRSSPSSRLRPRGRLGR